MPSIGLLSTAILLGIEQRTLERRSGYRAGSTRRQDIGRAPDRTAEGFDPKKRRRATLPGLSRMPWVRTGLGS